MRFLKRFDRWLDHWLDRPILCVMFVLAVIGAYTVMTNVIDPFSSLRYSYTAPLSEECRAEILAFDEEVTLGWGPR